MTLVGVIAEDVQMGANNHSTAVRCMLRYVLHVLRLALLCLQGVHWHKATVECR